MMKVIASLLLNVVSIIVLLLPVISWSHNTPDYRHMSDLSLDLIQEEYGLLARKRIVNWKNMLNRANTESLDELAMISLINDYFNKIKWKWDIDHWGLEDFWATPIETLATNSGDCEDISIGKYFSLINMGIDISKLRITYVNRPNYNLSHMVLAYYPAPDTEPLILDNINKSILSASQRSDLQPIYEFNSSGIWLVKSDRRLSYTNPARNLPRWGELNKRINKEINGLPY